MSSTDRLLPWLCETHMLNPAKCWSLWLFKSCFHIFHFVDAVITYYSACHIWPIRWAAWWTARAIPPCYACRRGNAEERLAIVWGCQVAFVTTCVGLMHLCQIPTPSYVQLSRDCTTHANRSISYCFLFNLLYFPTQDNAQNFVFEVLMM